jgi:hypothetical protein
MVATSTCIRTAGVPHIVTHGRKMSAVSSSPSLLRHFFHQLVDTTEPNALIDQAQSFRLVKVLVPIGTKATARKALCFFCRYPVLLAFV